jgi:hypothetical protein
MASGLADFCYLGGGSTRGRKGLLLELDFYAELNHAVWGKTEVDCGGLNISRHEGEEELAPIHHFVMTPSMPPDMREAILARIRGTVKPPGEARYFARQTGSNLSLYWRKPCKL